jgi:2'-5' RNA ligase
MYFIALVAPEKINDDIQKWKLWFRDHYGCTVALKSPAHITIIPPFRMEEETETDLKTLIHEFCNSCEKFEITLQNFNAFKPRVIFVDILKNEKLDILYQSFINCFNPDKTLPVKKDERPFHPHITLATRDLHKKNFYQSWQIFTEKKYKADWLVESISLLRHNKKNWEVIFTSRFKM